MTGVLVIQWLALTDSGDSPPPQQLIREARFI